MDAGAQEKEPCAIDEGEWASNTDGTASEAGNALARFRTWPRIYDPPAFVEALGPDMSTEGPRGGKLRCFDDRLPDRVLFSSIYRCARSA